MEAVSDNELIPLSLQRQASSVERNNFQFCTFSPRCRVRLDVSTFSRAQAFHDRTTIVSGGYTQTRLRIGGMP